MLGNVAFADDTCTVNVLGDFQVENSVYNYTTGGESSGVMSVAYQADELSEPIACTPEADGKITEIPKDATVVFCLIPNEGFVPELQINGTKVNLEKSPQADNLYVGSIVAPSGEVSVQAGFVTNDNASIVLNLKCVIDNAIKVANYDDNFKSTWATIEYSDDGGTTYKELNEGTTATAEGQYTFDSSIDEIKLKVTWTNEIMAALDQSLLQSGSEVTVGKGEHTAIFQQAVYTVAWAYTSGGAEIDENLLTKNGKISIDAGEGIQGTETENGGLYVIEPGTEVTIHLVPDYGYQFSKGTIGENLEVTPLENQSTFTFTMPKEQIVVGDIFAAHPDEVTVLTNSVVSGNISGADKVIESGNASLIISDSVITTDEKSKINSFASENGLEPIEYLDMELNNFVLKGSTDDKWENMLVTTASPVGISLTLADSFKNSDSYAVVKVHGSEISVVDSNYNASDRILNFETDGFSTYVIAKKSGSDSSGIFSVGNLKTGDQNKFWMYSVMMAASIAGFIYSFRRVRNTKFKI
ncbi:MAG: hypothetical protein IKE41_02955 [Clostridia bacterium]|nr:hypothetical protein [Clostridia bacterium]MBR2734679.1 hypothetical protein [Clostridia bacterium]